jgi:hypothetical protein
LAVPRSSLLKNPNKETTMTPTISKSQLWTSRILTGLALAFLAMDTVMKLLQLAPAIEGTVALGYPASAVFTIGVVELVCVALYAVPRTSLLGALLLTGYLGGAIASQLRIGAPLLSHLLFPTYIAALVWGGLYLRDARLRLLVPIRTHA